MGGARQAVGHGRSLPVALVIECHQRQEEPVVMYSMPSDRADDASRGVRFLDTPQPGLSGGHVRTGAGGRSTESATARRPVHKSEQRRQVNMVGRLLESATAPSEPGVSATPGRPDVLLMHDRRSCDPTRFASVHAALVELIQPILGFPYQSVIRPYLNAPFVLESSKSALSVKVDAIIGSPNNDDSGSLRVNFNKSWAAFASRAACCFEIFFNPGAPVVDLFNPVR